MTTENFLETLFGDKPPNDFILTWEKIHGWSSWFNGVQEAADYIHEHSDHDIYVGCGTSRQDMGAKNRCKAELIAGIPGFWLDLDMKDLVHKQKNLPNSEEEVQAVLSCFPFKPTMDIHSGHGRQFWWVLKEFWTFDSVDERMRAASLMQRFNGLFRNHAKSLGFALDMTFDLARILRIPGTTNYKADPAMPVLLLDCNDMRYNVDDVEEILPDVVLPAMLSPRQVATVQGRDFVLDPQADPPPAKFFALREAEPLFASSWEKKRRFKSPSEYDLSLATFAFQVGWSWQEVINLLMGFRRKHSLPLKTKIEGDPSSPIREDYYRLTLSKAQDGIIEQATHDNLADYVKQIGAVAALEPDQRAEVLRAHLTELFGFPCNRVVMLSTTPPEIRIETPKGTVMIGKVSHMMDQKVLRGYLVEIHEKLPYFTARRWQDISLALVDCIEDEYMGEDSSHVGMVTQWLQKYLTYRHIQYDPAEARRLKEPYASGDKFYIYGQSFRDWLRIFHKEALTPKDFGIYFKAFGFKPDEPKHIMGPSGDTTRLSWHLPVTNPVLAEFIDMDILDNANGLASTEKGASPI